MTKAARLGGPETKTYIVELEGERHEVVVPRDPSSAAGEARVILDGRPRRLVRDIRRERASQVLIVDDVAWLVRATSPSRGEWELDLGDMPVVARVRDALEERLARLSGGARSVGGQGPLIAPMPGLVVTVAVRPGDSVEPGDAVLSVEAMKMENQLRAQGAARVARILVGPGDAVSKGQVLVEFEGPGST